MIGLDLLGVADHVYDPRTCPPLTHCTDPAVWRGRDVVVGAYDMAAEQRKMNTLKVVPASVARALANGGLRAIDSAIAVAKGGFFHTLKQPIPGDTAREKVRGDLQGHLNALNLFVDPAAIYPGAKALKRAVMMAFVEFNAVEETRAYASQNTISRAVSEAWGEMWLAVTHAAAALPAALRKAVDEAMKAGTGLPMWAWALISVGSVGLVGYTVFRLLQPAVPVVARIAAARYLP